MSALVARILTVALLVVVSTGCTSNQPEQEEELVPSTATFGVLMVECLSEFGFHGEVQGHGLVVQVAPEQEDLYAKADAECQKRFGFDTTEMMTDEELGELYLFELQVQKCLEGLGYVIELPSEQVYIDTYYSAPEGEGFLLPHSQMMQQATNGADVDRAHSTCKQAPMLYDRPVG